MASVETRMHRGRKITVARWRDPVTGKQVSKSFPKDSKREAWKHIHRVEHSKETGSYVDPQRSKVTVGEWADRWLAAKANLAPKTRDRYEGIIHRHIRPRWGKVPLSAVGHADIDEWLSGLDLAPASVRKVHRVFSQVLAYAVKDGRLAVNPAAGVSLPRVRESDKRYMTHAQVDDLAEAVGPSYGLLVYFLSYTGLRWGEMAALRVERIDWLRRRVLVAESVTPVKGRMTFGDTKGHERREVPLPKFLVEELAQHVTDKDPGDLVFTGERGAVMRSQTFQRAALDRAAAELGIPGFHPHEFRHTAASLAIASGADVKVVQQMLGHKSATMTIDLYGHLFADRLDTVADAMDAARTVALGNRVTNRVTTADVVPLPTRSGL